jgi:hypothetical protein
MDALKGDVFVCCKGEIPLKGEIVGDPFKL